MPNRGADVWLNNPRMYREASGTSGMTAAMNGAINLSLPDGWIPEFIKDNDNGFIIQPAGDDLSAVEKDRQENQNLMDTLEKVIMPMYYHNQSEWLSILKKAATEVVPHFDASRMADEYYMIMYNVE